MWVLADGAGPRKRPAKLCGHKPGLRTCPGRRDVRFDRHYGMGKWMLVRLASGLADEVKAAIRSAAPREGARLTGLSVTQTGELVLAGVLGRGHGLTSRGVALRGILVREAEDAAFGPLS